MKLRNFILAIGLAAISAPAMAQYEGTSTIDRINMMLPDNDEATQARQQLSLFQMAVEQSNWAEAHECWKWLINKVPFAQKGIYTNGAYMLFMMVQAEQDVAKKQELFKELMDLYDLRVKNLAGLNSFEAPHKQATEGDIIARKAYDYAFLGPQGDPAFTLEKSYALFSDGINKINEHGGREVEGFVLDSYFRTSYAMYQKDNNGFREQFLQDYLESKDVCDRMLQLAKEEPDAAKAQKIVDKYDAPLNTIEGLFAQSKAADRDQIIAIFTPKVEANKDNLGYLKGALTVMAANDCDDTPVYYKAAEYAFNLEPSYESAIALAQKYAKEQNAAQSVKYYNEALDLCKSDNQKGSICIRIANAMQKSGDFTGAGQYLDKAVQFNADLEGKAFMQRANIAIKQKNYDQAIAFCNKAAEADITVSGSANRLKQNIQTVQAHNAEYARQKAAYDKQQAELKAEEDFWKAGGKK